MFHFSSRRSVALLAALVLVGGPVFTSGDSKVTVPVQVPGRSFTVEVPQPPAVVTEDTSKKPETIDTSEPVDDGDKSGGNPIATSDEPIPTYPPTAGDTEDLVTLTGPTEAKVGGYFIVMAKVPPPSDDVASEFLPAVPQGAMPPIELAGKNPGELVFLYQQVIQGTYIFRASAQVSVDKANGFDPHDTDELIVVVGGKPPEPEPDPEPDPTPDPVPGEGFRVLILYETADLGKLTPQQASVFTGGDVRAYLRSKVGKDANGVPEFRVWDDDYAADQMAFETPEWQAAYDKAKTDAAGRLPWVLILNGSKVAASEPLPPTVADTLTLLRKYGGN